MRLITNIDKSISLQKYAIDCINRGQLKAARDSLIESIELLPADSVTDVDNGFLALI